MSSLPGSMRAPAAPDVAPHAASVLPAALVLALLACLLIHGPTFMSMARTWLSTDTYLHGFIVLPIVLWLIWLRRGALASVPWRAAPLGIPCIVALSLLWLLGARAEVQVVQQLAATATLATLVVTIAGVAYARAIAFPLAFLVFAVPMGDGLVPWLMEFTADFTVGALQLSGISVYREGLLFSTTRGDFAVEKACSGVRYLIASITLGTLYAYLMYRSFQRRALFIALSALVPLLANGVRAYLIVVTAHLSNMEMAVGIDHIIYGWVFFGLVMLGLFAAGRWFREVGTHGDAISTPAAAIPRGDAEANSVARISVVAGAAIAALAIGPAIAASSKSYADVPAVRPQLARIDGDWRGPFAPVSSWRPLEVQSERYLAAGYVRPGSVTIDVIVRSAAGASRRSNGSAEPAISGLGAWREYVTGYTDVALEGGTLTSLRTSRLVGPEGRRTAWSVYVVDDRFVADGAALDRVEAWAKVRGQFRSTVLIVFSTPEAGGQSAAALKEFLERHLGAFADCAVEPSTLCEPGEGDVVGN